MMGEGGGESGGRGDRKEKRRKGDWNVNIRRLQHFNISVCACSKSTGLQHTTGHHSTPQHSTAQHSTAHHTTAQSLSPTAAPHSTPHALDTPAEAPLQGMLHTRTHLGPVCAHAAGNRQGVSDAVEGVGQPWGWSLCDTPMTQALPRVSIPATLFTPRGGGERCLMAHQPTRTAGVDLRKCVAPLCM